LRTISISDKRKNHTIEVLVDRLLGGSPASSIGLEMSVGLAMKLAGGLVQVSRGRRR